MANEQDKIPVEVILFSPIKISSSRICLFCLKTQPSSLSSNEIQSKQKLLQLFFKVSERYFKFGKNDSLREIVNWLISNHDEGDGSSEFLKNNLDTCDDCSLLLQDFCDTYNEISVLQMRLNWKVDTLRSIMTTANKVSYRVRDLQETCMKKNVFDTVKQFRSEIVREALRKLNSSLPKLYLSKVQPKQETQTSANNVKDCSHDHDQNFLTKSEFIEPNGTPLDCKVPETQNTFNLRYSMEISEPFAYKQDANNVICEEAVESDNLSASPDNGPESPSPPTSEIYSYDASDHLTNGSELPEIKSNAKLDLEKTIEKTDHEQNTQCSLEGNEIPEVPRSSSNSSPSLETPLEQQACLQNIKDSNKLAVNDKILEESLKSIDSDNCDAKDFNCTPSTFRRSTRRCVRNKVKENVDAEATAIQDPEVIKSSKSADKDIDKPKIKQPSKSKVVKLAKVEGDSQDNFTSLKQLALKKVMDLKFICDVPPCKSLVFINERNYRSHQFYHGNFKCNFCEVVMNYAPDLSDHEIRKHSQPLIDKEGRNCSRCEFHNLKLNKTVEHHLTVHLKLDLDRFTCPICDARIKPETNSRILEHYNAFHDLSKLDYDSVKKCDIENCWAYFRTGNHLVLHKKFVHKDTSAFLKPEHICQICKKSFTTKKGLGIHKKFQHFVNYKPTEYRMGPKWFQKIKLSPSAKKLIKPPTFCKVPKCGKEFYNEADLKNHSKLHGKFKCNFCDVVVTYARDLLTHEITHLEENEKASRCPRCSFSAKSPPSIVTHFFESHLNLKADYYTCHICNATLRGENQRYSFPFHFKNSHDFSKQVYNCEEIGTGCEAYFNTELQLKVHRNKHKFESAVVEDPEGKNRFRCKKCGKTSKTGGSLILHEKKCLANFHLEEVSKSNSQQTSENYANFSCTDCEKSFKNKRSLLIHIKVHDGNRNPKRPFVCETCGKSFKDKCKLKLHLLAHTGPETWEFMCSQCGKRCLTEQKLEEHLRTHTKEKPFCCEICGISYAHRHNLRLHINSKHNDVSSDPARSNTSQLTSKNGMKSRQQIKRKPEHGFGSGKLPKRRKKRQPSSSSDTTIDSSYSDSS